MRVEKIDYDFSICKVEDYSQVNFESEYYFIGRTDEENSLVCITEDAPGNVTERDDGWKAFRIQGTLDFSLIGILSEISTLLAENEIGIFAVSTYNTDYILTKSDNYDKALKVLCDAGYDTSERREI
ncbi:MAG: ACT domain-containing protein [Lachnospiraceae bacterium]|nr:ACT domain-containing protein [Lachnospiraceae bacterium]